MKKRTKKKIKAKTGKRNVKMYEEVIIKATGEHAYVVWHAPNFAYDSYLLDLKDKFEMPLFYVRDDFDPVVD